MREFNIIQHGAGKNFLGAIQQVIRSKETVVNIEKQIKINNLFDGIYAPFHFNPNWYDRTDWNKALIESHIIWRQVLENKYSKLKGRKDIIDRLNTCYTGTFHLNYSLPGIPHYGIVCIIDSPEQRADLDTLAFLKKQKSAFENGLDWHKSSGAVDTKEWRDERVLETNLIHGWETENMNHYKADYTYDYTSLFHELDPNIIADIVQRTEETFKVESAVTVSEVTTLIAKYNRKNMVILAYE
jgi:hypothetical protein